MRKTKKEMALEMWKTTKRNAMIAGIFEVPILIILWSFGYKLGFWIYLTALIILGIGYAIQMGRLEEIMEIKCQSR